MAGKARTVSTEIGITETRKIDIYKLSIGAEKRIWGVLEEAKDWLNEKADEYEGYGEIPLPEVIDMGMSLFIDNIETILDSITKDEDVKELMEEIDNEQLIEIARIVYEENVESVKKDTSNPESEGNGSNEEENQEENEEYRISYDEVIATVSREHGFTSDVFYVLNSYEGGITRSELELYFECIQKEKIERMKFDARLHGANIDGDSQSKEKGQLATDPSKAHIDNANVYEYGDGENGAFSGWTEEQKEEATNNQLRMLMNLPI